MAKHTDKSTVERPASDAVAVRLAATVACVRDGAAGPEVVLLRRAGTHVFCPGAHVFPGGAVDAADARCAETLLGVEERRAEYGDDAARRVAAAREVFEEAGLLVGLRASRALGSAELMAARTELNAGHQDWRATCEQLGLTPAPDQLVAIGFRLTPPGWPRRFATRFFLAAAEPSAEPSCDDEETDAADWWRPQQALVAADAGHIELVRPTRIALGAIANFVSVADLFTAVCEHGEITLLASDESDADANREPGCES